MSEQELHQIADYLSGKQNAILKQWKELMQQDQRKASELILQSRGTFYNSIPSFLEHFYGSLRNESTSLKEISREHGLNRWEYGYELPEIVKEWETLHMILIDQIKASQNVLISGLPAVLKAQKLLSKSIHSGILFSVKEYGRLQQQEAEAQMNDLKQALQESEGLPTENLRETSHDLRGTVHILRTGFFLLKDYQLNKNVAEIVHQMSLATDSLNQLLNDLLDLFRLEAGKEKLNIEHFDAAKLLRDLCESNQPLAQAEQLDLRCEGDKELHVRSDPQKVQRIIQNLVLNSLKYTRSGFVKVEWKLKENNYWMIKIRDTGPGLGATHASSLTTETNSSEAQDQPSASDSSGLQSHGEGIGLLIVRRLCELLNAVIDVQTQKGEGTIYQIIFPVEVNKD